LDDPIIPTRLPEAFAKKKPTRIMTIAATMPPVVLPDRYT